MRQIIKIATLLATTAVLSFASSALDKQVLDYQKKAIEHNPALKLNSIKIVTKKELAQSKGWYGYIIALDLEMGGKQMSVNDTIFSNGKVITRELVEMASGNDMSSYISIDFKDSDYSDEHIIAGNKGAKNRLVVFSDPHCPACVGFAPFMIELVKSKPNDMVLYYYHYPLKRIHPLAETITRASIVAKKQGIKDVELKVYRAKLTAKGISKEEALAEFNKKLSTNIKMADLDKKWITQVMEKDEKLGNKLAISGTPTLFVNNKRDDSRTMLKTLLNK